MTPYIPFYPGEALLAPSYDSAPWRGSRVVIPIPKEKSEAFRTPGGGREGSAHEGNNTLRAFEFAMIPDERESTRQVDFDRRTPGVRPLNLSADLNRHRP